AGRRFASWQWYSPVLRFVWQPSAFVPPGWASESAPRHAASRAMITARRMARLHIRQRRDRISLHPRASATCDRIRAFRPVSGLEGIAHPVDRADRVLAGARLLEVAAQVLDVTVERAVGDDAAVGVEAIDELRARPDAAGRLRERLEQPELDRGELEVAPVPGRTVARLVDVEAGHRGARALHPAQNRAHARDDLARAVRLADVLVGAELEPDEAVHRLDTRGHHHDRHVGEAPELATDVEPVLARQHQ